MRNEEKNHSFTEMAKYTNHCKRHSGKIAICISNEYFGWIPASEIQIFKIKFGVYVHNQNVLCYPTIAKNKHSINELEAAVQRIRFHQKSSVFDELIMDALN